MASEAPGEPAATAARQEAVRKLLDAAADELRSAAAVELEAGGAANDAALAAGEAERLQTCEFRIPNSCRQLGRLH